MSGNSDKNYCTVCGLPIRPDLTQCLIHPTSDAIRIVKGWPVK